MENEDHYKALLQKYIHGKSSPEEAELVLGWLQTPGGIHALKDCMDAAAQDAFLAAPELDPRVSSEIYVRLQHQLKPGRNATDRTPAGKRSVAGLSALKKLRGSLKLQEKGKQLLLSRSKKWRIAAALTGFLLLATATYQLLKNYNTVTYSTDFAQKEVIILPDNSTVTLNGNSRLSFSKNWKRAAIRRVHLEGEAFFEVVRHEDKPFIVTTSDIDIKVLGTSFNVKSYDEEETIETTLVSGKVVIENPEKDPLGRQTVLKPNQKATYSKRSSSIVLDEVKTELYTSWKSGMLIFEDEPFGEIARELERWYGVQIEIKDEASRQCRFTVKIRDEPLVEVLDLFLSITAANYSVDGKKVVVEGKLCR